MPLSFFTTALFFLFLADPISATDLYCLAGQSNMLGWTLGGQSISGDSNFLASLVSQLDVGSGADASTLTSLIEPYHTNAYVYESTVVDTEVNALLDLKSRGLTSALTTPLQHATFLVPQYSSSSAPINVNLADAWYSGISYGPEYMFSRTMQTEYCSATATNPMQIQKLAYGGTQIYKDWSPTLPGTRWNQFQDVITTNAPADGTYQGFVWFQGENDCFHDPNDPSDDTFLYYEGNLTELIAEVRNQMYQHSPETSAVWDSPEQIPVVIVEIGHWPRFTPDVGAHVQMAGDIVVAAQQAVAAADPCVDIVTTNDLCRFFHFDPPSQFIIGDRVAHAMAALTARCRPSGATPCCDNCGVLLDRLACQACNPTCKWSKTFDECGDGNGGGGGGGAGGGGEPPLDCSTVTCSDFTSRGDCLACPTQCTWQNQQGTKTCVGAGGATSNTATLEETFAPAYCGPCSQLEQAEQCSNCACRWDADKSQCKPLSGNAQTSVRGRQL